MDRFIEFLLLEKLMILLHLKSNMDRFIAGLATGAMVIKPLFKIQYG